MVQAPSRLSRYETKVCSRESEFWNRKTESITEKNKFIKGKGDSFADGFMEGMSLMERLSLCKAL